MPGMPSKRVPPAVWEPIAERIASEYGVSRQAMLFHGVARMFFVPRAKFWRALRALPEGYSLSAIADITGHHHSSLISAFDSANSNLPPSAIKIQQRIIPNLVGKIFGTLAVISLTAQRRANQRVWLCRCKNCGGEIDLNTQALLQHSECPTCKRAKYSHRIEQPQHHHRVRGANKEGVNGPCQE